MKKFVPFLFLIGLAACGTSPEPAYFTLSPLPGAARAHTARAIEILTPDLPGYLDRQELVRRDDARVVISENDCWAAPLDAMIAHVLAQDVQKRLPAGVVAASADGGVLHPDFTVLPEIESFDASGNGTARLTGAFIVKDNRAATRRTLPFAYTEPAADGAAATVDALDRLLARAADDLAAQIATSP